MKDAVKVYLAKIATLLDNLLNCPSAERTTERKKPAQSSLQSASSRPEQQASHQSGRLANRKQERRKFFTALAFVLLFASLCGISLLGQKSASAVAAHSSSATLHHSASTSLNHLDTGQTPVDCTNPANISDNSCYGGGDPVGTVSAIGQYTLGSDCSSHYATAGNNTLCWNDADFGWGNRDITCIQNPKFNTQLDSFNTDHPGVNFGTGMIYNTSGTPIVNSANGPSAQFYNQDSCLDASTCYSNNASHNDDSGQIHDLIGGNDLVCYNNACIGNSPGNTTPGGDCGSGVPYDKFGCSPIPNLSGWYYNPTAYNPIGSLEQINTNFKGGYPFEVNSDSKVTITCNSSNQWSCPTGDAVVLFMDEGDPGALIDPFSLTDPNHIGNIIIYPPTYEVFCSNTGSNWFFPCSNIGYLSSSEGKIDEGTIKTDWLSGDGGVGPGSGHLAVTYLDDTVSQPNVQALFNLMLGLGYVLLTPVLFLIGYQMLWASWTFGRATIMEAFGRLLLSIIALAISWELAGMLIALSNSVNAAVVFLHVHIPYPTTHINNQNLTYTLDGESDPLSYRGIVIPISRWGCVMNDFVKILGTKFASDMAAFIPFVGGLIKLALGIYDAVDAFKHIGEFLELILSIMLATQIFVRLILINYYILTGPVALACWALPGGVGQKVVSQWFKGFCSLLFVQGVQLFILTTLPLVVPSFPNLPADKFGIVDIFFAQLPRVIVLLAVVQAPKMVGTGATKAIAQAGKVAGGAVVAVGAAAYQIV